MDTADAGLEAAPGGVGQIQAGVQNGNQHALTGVTGSPDLTQVGHVVAVAEVALDQLAGGGDGTGEDPLHIDGSDTLDSAQGIDLAVGNADSHSIDRIDIAAGDVQLHTHGLAHNLNQVVLAVLQGCGLGCCGGQVCADLAAH